MVDPWAWLPIMGISIAATLTIEFVLWLMVYRHQSFQSLRVSLARQAKKLEEIKAAPAVPGKLKSKQKREKQIENQMRNDSAREFTTVKLKQSVLTMALVFMSYKFLGKSFEGKVVARLPFEPFSLLAKLTNRGLAELNDSTACAWTFIFAMCQTGLRPTISKLLDLGPSRQMMGLSSISTAGERHAETMVKGM